jgi:hypothetical protein
MSLNVLKDGSGTMAQELQFYIKKSIRITIFVQIAP